MSGLMVEQFGIVEGMVIVPPEPGDNRLRVEVRFPNGYGASIITGFGAHADDECPFELAVLVDGCCCYDTPITEDTIGYMTASDVRSTLVKISELPPRAEVH